ncbi:hypothetical protein HMPREF1869_00006 [Bacteroidales bacterium KA00251]|nr:hypothetical protein HMPREF1869_00006 [Bacteroidales bacterium KA00251]
MCSENRAETKVAKVRVFVLPQLILVQQVYFVSYSLLRRY